MRSGDAVERMGEAGLAITLEDLDLCVREQFVDEGPDLIPEQRAAGISRTDRHVVSYCGVAL